jgi:hypothetical protein
MRRCLFTAESRKIQLILACSASSDLEVVPGAMMKGAKSPTGWATSLLSEVELVGERPSWLSRVPQAAEQFLTVRPMALFMALI